jgi:hypothetical protein
MSASAPAAAPASQVAGSAKPLVSSNGEWVTGRPICQLSSRPMASARSTIQIARRPITSARLAERHLPPRPLSGDGAIEHGVDLCRGRQVALGHHRAVYRADRLLDVGGTGHLPLLRSAAGGGDAVVNEQLGAGHEVRLVGRQEQRGLCDLGRFGQAALEGGQQGRLRPDAGDE